MVENLRSPDEETASSNLFRPGSFPCMLVPCVANSMTGSFIPLCTLESYQVQLTQQRGSKTFSPLDRGGKTPRPWTEKEDERLKSLVEEFGQHSWKAVAQQLNTESGSACRTNKHCRDRWVNHINPELNKGQWTFSEDIALLNQYKHAPNKWALIARKLPGRNQTLVKNRFWTLLKRTKDTYHMHCMHTHLIVDFLITQLSTFVKD